MESQVGRRNRGKLGHPARLITATIENAGSKPAFFIVLPLHIGGATFPRTPPTRPTPLLFQRANYPRRPEAPRQRPQKSAAHPAADHSDAVDRIRTSAVVQAASGSAESCERDIGTTIPAAVSHRRARIEQPVPPARPAGPGRRGDGRGRRGSRHTVPVPDR